MATTRTRDPFGYDIVDTPAAAVVPTGGIGGVGGSGGASFVPAGALVRTDTRGMFDTPTTVVVPDEPAPKLPGSPLNTLYGVDSESYLTDEQRKLARMIQGQFDASSNRRDRELARWGAPHLSSDTQDEALARAMSLARGLNFPTDLLTNLPSTDNGVGGIRGAGAGNVPAARPYYPELDTPTRSTSPTGAQTNAKWQRILTGLTSIAPLLFGKNAFGQFMNDGLIKTVKDYVTKTFGLGYMDDQTFENIVRTGVLPSDPTGTMILNPITGMPMAIDPALSGPQVDYGDPYGPYSGWGDDLLATPDYSGWYGDGSAWSDPWSGWTPESGGDWLDLFGGV